MGIPQIFEIVDFSLGRVRSDYKICMFCFSAKHASLMRKAKTCGLEMGIMCPNGETYLSPDYFFCELSHSNSNWACWYSTKRSSSSYHWTL